MNPRILIGGIGNIFLGDDAFGVEVVRRLAARPLPEGVRLVDFGIRGLDLAYALLDGCEHAILVDAAPRGGAPGTIYVIEPELNGTDQPDPAGVLIDMHRMDPARVLRLVAMLGGKLDHLIVVGCEPSPTDSEDMQSEMSPSVAAAVDQAVEMVESLVHRLLQEGVEETVK
jgi:hydrogenase maturation protease